MAWRRPLPKSDFDKPEAQANDNSYVNLTSLALQACYVVRLWPWRHM